MEEVVAEIVPGLFVGSLRSLGYLEQLGITHVLSVLNFEVTRDLSDYTTLRLPLRDEEDAALLVHLPAAYTFIHSALTGQQVSVPRDPLAPSAEEEEEEDAEELAQAKRSRTDGIASGSGRAGEGEGAAGKVLVHCQAGQSRSVAVVVAYLMKTRGLDESDALALVRTRWKQAEPNDGFMAQLALFHDMRCSLDQDHPVYRLWCLQQVGKRREDEGWVDPESFAPSPAQASGSKAVLYRCRKCRRLLASSRNVVPVDEATAGHKVFRDRRPGRVATTEPLGAEGGSSLFLEPMDWMASAAVGAVQGKLYCPQCDARLGSFNWSGITNEAGLWVTPAFQVHTSRLDLIRPAPTLPSGSRPGLPAAPRVAQPAAAAAGPPPPAQGVQAMAADPHP